MQITINTRADLDAIAGTPEPGEQVEEEATAQGIVDKLKKAGDAGIFFIDSQLGHR